MFVVPVLALATSVEDDKGFDTEADATDALLLALALAVLLLLRSRVVGDLDRVVRDDDDAFADEDSRIDLGVTVNVYPEGRLFLLLEEEDELSPLLLLLLLLWWLSLKV